MKRVRISNNSLNSYGSRVLTEGMDVQQYCRNPVLLYMHERGNVIDYVKDLKVENDEPVKYPEIAYAIASTCDALCKEIAGLEMGDTPHDPRELVVGIIQKTFEVAVDRMQKDLELDIETIPTILRDLRVGEIEVSDDDC